MIILRLYNFNKGQLLAVYCHLLDLSPLSVNLLVGSDVLILSYNTAANYTISSCFWKKVIKIPACMCYYPFLCLSYKLHIFTPINHALIQSALHTNITLSNNLMQYYILIKVISHLLINRK